MYPQVQESGNNKEMYIGLAVLALLIVGGILLYVFVFKCKEDGDECIESSDCCEELECIDSICSTSTPNVTPQPVVAANPVTEPEPEPELEPELEPEPEPVTCANWDITNDCATGTTLTPGSVIGSSPEDCCRPLTCQEWGQSNSCWDTNRINIDDFDTAVISNSQSPEDSCCMPQRWYISGADNCPGAATNDKAPECTCTDLCNNQGLVFANSPISLSEENKTELLEDRMGCPNAEPTSINNIEGDPHVFYKKQSGNPLCKRVNHAPSSNWHPGPSAWHMICPCSPP